MTRPLALTLDDRADWFDLASAALDHLIETEWLFSSDDLRPLVPTPAHPNWYGAVFTAASNAGRITKAGPMVSRSKSRRGGLIWQWKKVVKHEERTP